MRHYHNAQISVNAVIKPLRVSNISSLNYGSIAGEVRLNERTSSLWMRRFDLPEGSPKLPPTSLYRCISAEEQQRINTDNKILDDISNKPHDEKFKF
ncbi:MULTISPECIES: DUF3396 domain-containing protein [Pseudomonas]|uniref:DUF3396 domain-containing protein n=1 Tax=Pseudomonas saxonica TaxID=2600598 RepID=A0ABY3GD04_9PSED|nr:MULTISPECIES: DUF3396 domain-containing protein [Pseudomonas]MCH4875310.1 DUF3396 domain-containing protein [Pseudomonas sp. TMW22091]TWR86185.1 DUF3396 domain-containing protein [Pseudomonas saxonica]